MADYSTVTIRPFNPTGNVANIGLAWTQWVEELILFFGAKDVTKPMVKCNQLLYYGGERVQQIWKTLPESTTPFDVNIHGQAQQVNERPPTSEEAALATSISALRVVVDQATLRLAAAAPEDIDSATSLHAAAHTALDKARNCLLAARTAVTSQRTSRIEHPAPKDEFDYLLYALNRVFVGQTSNTYNRFQFNNLRPDARETSSQFLIKLKGKIKSCNFADQEQTLVDMLISHTSNNELRRELLKKGDELNFDTALMISRTVEATESQARAIEGSGSTEQIAKVFSHNKKTGTCHRCGKSDHYANDPVCKARYKTCSRCNKTGHFAEVCRSSGSGSIPKYPMAAKEKPPVFKKEKKFTYKKGRIHKVEHEDLNFVQSSSSADFAFSIDGRFKNDTEKSIKVNVGGVELQFEIDSCSSTNIISSSTWENCKRMGIKCKSTRITKDLYPYNSLTPLKTIGKFECELKVGRFTTFDEVYVVHGNDKSLLSERTSKALRVLKVGLHVQRESIRAVTKATENQYHDAATPNTRRANSAKQHSRAIHQQPVASTADRKQINTATNNTNITENKGNLQLKQEIIQEFPEVFTGMGKLKDYELELVIDPSMAPALQPLRPVPLQQQPKVEKKLEELLNCDIIEPVNYPSKFCSPLHVANKPDNEIRFCVDMRVANLCVQRLNHPIPRFEEVCSNLKGSTVFSKLDMKNAYFQIQLSKASREITTFSTHKGLFRYKRLFCGINCAPEAFQKIMEIATKDCEGLEVYIDDFLIHGATREIHDQRLRHFLRKFKQLGLTLNYEKCVFATKQVHFRGHCFSADGVKPIYSRVKAMQELQEPTTPELTASVLGLFTYSGRFIPNFSQITKPLRNAANCKSKDFKWGPAQEKAFQLLKKHVTTTPVLGYFDPNLPTYVVSDASPFALGAVLFQIKNDKPVIIEYASRSLTEVESRYSQTEKEALGLVWSCERFHFWLFGGKKFFLITDHKPLEFIFSIRAKPCARIERWVLRLQCYNYQVMYQAGKSNIADPLSRLLPNKAVTPATGEEDLFVRSVVDAAMPIAMSFEEIRQASISDSHTKMLATAVNTDTWPVELRKYELIKTELCVYDDVILRGHRLYIPGKLRSRVLKLAHEGHQGIVKTKQRLRSKVWWFTMDKDVEEFCKHCHGCQIVAPFELPEPLKPTALPTGSWKDIAIDYLGPFPNGKNILVVIDYYSRFIEAVITTSTTAATTINILEEIFCRFGYPESMRADQAPQLSGSEMRDYCLLNGIRLVSTTPRYPQANGEVERQNRSIMKVLKIANAEKDDLQKALNTYLLAYRSTPHSVTGVSPAKLMFNREIRDKLPNLYVQVALEQSVRDRDAEYKASSKDYTDRARRASQKKLEIGDDVLVRQQVQNKLDTQYCPVPFQITAKDGNAITVRAPSGTEYRRNSTWAKPYQPPLPETDTELSTLEEKQQDNSSPVVAQSPVRTRVQELQQKETLANTPIWRSNRERHAPKRLITEC